MRTSTPIWLLPLLALLAGLAGCSKPEPAAAPPRPVRSIVVKAESLAPSATYSGEVRARYETPLAFRVAGKLAERRVEVGSVVKKGQVLARLDEADLQLQAAAGEAGKVAAQAQLTRAKSDYERFKALREKNLVSEFDFKNAQTAYEVARSQFDQAVAQARVGDNQAGYTQLIADANGVVTALQAEIGQVVAAGQPVVTLARSGEREVQIAVPESRVDELRRATDIAVRLWAKPEKAYPGKVREIAPDTDPVTRTYNTRITVQEVDTDLKLGMTATVTLTGAGAQAVRLPLTAIYQTDAQPKVWLVDGNQQVNLQPVTLGDFVDNDVIVIAGLKDGDRVVTAGVNRLVPAQHVKLIEGE
ncbi:efflux RND transporter periplasmic adaptor subunit [Permianibacter sp. IMCC34836]|uniref:efflux RND transporter periplasmic adaptor subunit n=1 Tax=Permianibacter fluminis TaxID=2738515 RepID=UPI0015582707|nr:efflux RND transporter periplasmic adaptor subunit [Permianibacter fluminis]NQD38984.1 efflux RND transporter periplasmic adaptor subunit [Permianibacter fluminis]